MPNNPAFFAKQGSSYAPFQLDSVGTLLTTVGGSKSLLNITAAAVIKATPGRVGRLIIVAPGSGSGAFTLNDCATLGAAAAANVLWTLPYNSASNLAGATFVLDFPFLVGLVLSAVPGAGSPILGLSFT